MNKFYVVVRWLGTGIFQEMNYATDKETLSEEDLLRIKEHHAEKGNGAVEFKTQIISWQRIV
ncbi:hypothetical protein COE51_01355 [Bacillus pseudomycoides]|nr:hypothetical protein COE51_01355 [Bacillus pseudomycoides]